MQLPAARAGVQDVEGASMLPPSPAPSRSTDRGRLACRAAPVIVVREGAMDAYDWVSKGPKVMRVRLLSLRAHDAAGRMIDVDVVKERNVEPVVARLLAGPAVA